MFFSNFVGRKRYMKKRISKKVFLLMSAALVVILWVVRMVFPDVAAVDGNSEQKPAETFVPHPIRSVPNFSTSFPDVQDTQIVAARRYGITPLATREEMELRKGDLVYIGSSPYYVIDKGMNASVPYLVPRASLLLGDISRNYLDSLAAKGVPLHKLIVSSVLRTESDVGRLRRGNANASDQSCHRFGTTFDICYNRYETVSLPGEERRPVSSDTLKWVLAEVLRDMRQQQRCYVKYEVKQGCFHITTR